MPSSSSGTTTAELDLHAFYTATEAYLAYYAFHHSPFLSSSQPSRLDKVATLVPRLIRGFFVTSLELDTSHLDHTTSYHREGLGQHQTQDASTFQTVMADLNTAHTNAVALLDGLSTIMDRTAGVLRRCGRESEALTAQFLVRRIMDWAEGADSLYAKEEAETRALSESMAGVSLRTMH